MPHACGRHLFKKKFFLLKVEQKMEREKKIKKKKKINEKLDKSPTRGDPKKIDRHLVLLSWFCGTYIPSMFTLNIFILTIQLDHNFQFT